MTWQLFLAVCLAGPVRAAADICRSCTRVDNKGNFVQTDVNGTVVRTFHCGNSMVTRAFCENPDVTKIDYVEPRPYEVCKASTKAPQICFRESMPRVTFWSDERIPSHMNQVQNLGVSAHFLSSWQQMHFRDVYPDELEFFNQTRALTVFGTYGTSIFKALTGYGLTDPLLTGIPTRNFLSDMPRFSHHGDKLVLYTGYSEPQLAHHGWCPEAQDPDQPMVPGRYSRCAGIKLLKYLTSHRKIDLHRVDLTVTMFFEPLFTTAAIDVAKQYVDQLCCTSAQIVALQHCDCHRTQRYRVSQMEGNKPFASDPGHAHASFKWNSYRGVANAPWAVSNLWPNDFLPAAMERNSPEGITLVHLFINHENESLVTYPLMSVYVRDPLDLRARYTWVEESPDGVHWSVHPESVSDHVAVLIQERNWVGLKHMAGDQVAFRGAGGGAFIRTYMNTGRNKYLRITYAYPMGSAFPSGRTPYETVAARHNTDVYYPIFVLGARERGVSDVLVMPSPPPGRQHESAYLGMDYCRNLASCTFLDDAPTSYPLLPAGRSTSGSAAARDYIRDQLRPRLFGRCAEMVDDPVPKFLKWAGDVDETPTEQLVCYRLTDSVTDERCYHTRPDGRADNSTVVTTDLLNTRVSYSHFGQTLSVYARRRTENPYPVPKVVLGAPFTHANMVPAVYLYDVPVPGALLVEGRFVTDTEKCERAPPESVTLMPQEPGCQCMSYPVSNTHCLCAPAGKTYSVYRNNSRDALLFDRLPSTFEPTRIPLNYTLVRKQLLFDSDVFTSLDLDCPSFLCADSRECLDALARSNYLTFCLNQRTILTNTLNSMREGRDQVDLLVHEFVEVYGIDPLSDMESLSPGSEFAPANNSALGNMGDALKDYVRINAATPLRVTLPGRNLPAASYQNPSTPPVMAVAMAFTPASNVLNQRAINELNYRNKVQDAKIDALREFGDSMSGQIATLSSQMRAGLQEAAKVMLQLAGTHNALIKEINQRFVPQKELNVEFAVKIEDVARQLSTAINFQDLAAARANTLAVKSAAIMVKSLDYEIRARNFADRVRACRNVASVDAVKCADSTDGRVISTLVRREGSVNLLDNLVLVPDHHTTVYASVEFCYNDTHYYVTSKRDRFVVHQDRIMLTDVGEWNPRELTLFNTMRTPCRVPSLSVRDLVPAVPSVDLNLVSTRAFLDGLNSTTDFDLEVLSGSFGVAADLIEFYGEALGNFTQQTDQVREQVQSSAITLETQFDAVYDANGELSVAEIGWIASGAMAGLAVVVWLGGKAFSG